MPRFKLTIEYCGTRYSGWQIQKNARTVQGEIDRAVRTVSGRRDFELYGSGRTDAGVHALAQVAHLDLATNLPADRLVQRINDELPSDINVLHATVVPHRFHARHHALARRYLYQIARRRTAFAKPFVWWVREPLDVGRMRDAAAAFVGLKDFASFAAMDDDLRAAGAGTEGGPGASSAAGRPDTPRSRRKAATTAGAGKAGTTDEAGGSGRKGRLGLTETPEARGSDHKSTLVLVERLDIVEAGDLVLIGIEGSHFLWKMVRRIVGVLAEIGRGGLDPSASGRLLGERSALPARLTAPPSGLFLERVYYEGDPRDPAIRPITPLRRVREEYL